MSAGSKMLSSLDLTPNQIFVCNEVRRVAPPPYRPFLR
jgi:hypothetical protein